MTMTIDSTDAAIGRSMKKRDISYPLRGGCGAGRPRLFGNRVARHFLGFLGTYLDAWPSAIHAIDNDPGVSFEPFHGAAAVFLQPIRRADVHALDDILLFLVHDQDVLEALVGQ